MPVKEKVPVEVETFLMVASEKLSTDPNHQNYFPNTVEGAIKQYDEEFGDSEIQGEFYLYEMKLKGKIKIKSQITHEFINEANTVQKV